LFESGLIAQARAPSGRALTGESRGHSAGNDPPTDFRATRNLPGAFGRFEAPYGRF